MDVAEIRLLRKRNDARAKLEELGWYHSFRFPDGSEFRGILSTELLEYRYSKFPIPADLTGKRVLDIGAWDGWFGFEAERRGADVTAIDAVEVANFLKVHRKLESRVDYRELDLFDVPKAGLGSFDYVFFLGVLYHVRHPMLALEIVCAATKDVAIVESYVTDAHDWEEHRNAIPVMEFYETDELGGQLDNWFGPTVSCVAGLCRAAGFARVEVMHVENSRAAFACYRFWEESSGEPLGPAPALRSVTNSIRGGINFRTTREDYLAFWFDHEGDSLDRFDIRLEAGGFGVATMYTGHATEKLWLATCRLPPGLGPGWHEARMSIRGGGWSEAFRFAVDVEPWTQRLAIETMCDSATWKRNEVRLSAKPAFISAWITGLGENCDETNTCLEMDGCKLRVTFVGEADENGARQVNAAIPAETATGEHELRVRFGAVESAPVTFRAD